MMIHTSRLLQGLTLHRLPGLESQPPRVQHTFRAHGQKPQMYNFTFHSIAAHCPHSANYSQASQVLPRSLLKTHTNGKGREICHYAAALQRLI